MYKSYVLVFQNTDTKKLKMDTVAAKSEAGAKTALLECYRHGNYKILSVAEIPD